MWSSSWLKRAESRRFRFSVFVIHFFLLKVRIINCEELDRGTGMCLDYDSSYRARLRRWGRIF